ncbi:MAG: hypothetical protein IJS05_03970 [Paludibacteraceae bacterium]|nr:hypothetical protein [Paludibacteraceae bacterium]
MDSPEPTRRGHEYRLLRTAFREQLLTGFSKDTFRKPVSLNREHKISAEVQIN